MSHLAFPRSTPRPFRYSALRRKAARSAATASEAMETESSVRKMALGAPRVVRRFFPFFG
ncbi:MAG TPA: hypothetical protein PKW81_02460 [Synergistales bacterium]|nr:hypothetical protein [Synergistales bacterium]